MAAELQESDIKPCPFCPDGGKLALVTELRHGNLPDYIVECQVCEASLSWDITPHKAIKKWNQRAHK